MQCHHLSLFLVYILHIFKWIAFSVFTAQTPLSYSLWTIIDLSTDRFYQFCLSWILWWHRTCASRICDYNHVKILLKWKIMSNLQWKNLSVKVWINLRSNVKRLDAKGFLQEHRKVLIFTLKKICPEDSFPNQTWFNHILNMVQILIVPLALEKSGKIDNSISKVYLVVLWAMDEISIRSVSFSLARWQGWHDYSHHAVFGSASSLSIAGTFLCKGD